MSYLRHLYLLISIMIIAGDDEKPIGSFLSIVTNSNILDKWTITSFVSKKEISFTFSIILFFIKS